MGNEKGQKMKHGQLLYDRGDPTVGSLSYTGFETRRACVESIAISAHKTNMKPPHKWIFWRCQWPDDVLAEFNKCGK